MQNNNKIDQTKMAKPTVTRRSFLASLGATFAALAAWRPAWAQTRHVADVTFVLFNDFYLMAEQPFPDGKLRGGFARLAAVIKAERARARNVIVVHGGDTLSPSIMSGFDRGAHIVALTNMVAPDIFVPGNHEFDFGKAVFLERMSEASFPLYGANLRDANGASLPRFKDRTMLTVDGVRIGLTGLAYEQSARMSSPEDLVFASTIATTKAQAGALRQEGADFVVAVLHCNRGDAIALQYSGVTDLLLTGHTHDLFVNFTESCALAESGYDAHFVTCIDATITVREDGGKRAMTWWPQFRLIDTATVTPDPEVAAAVARFQAALADKMDLTIATTTVELDSRTATVRTREAAIGNLFADAMRATTRADVALLNGGGIRAGKTYQPGAAITHGDILSELPFSNRVVALELSGRDLRRAVENGLALLPRPSGRFPQVSGITVTYDAARDPGSRIVAMQVAGAPLDEGKSYRVAVVDFLARGGDDYAMLREAKRVTPDNDAPLLVNEVVDYVRNLGVVRTGVEGRVAPK
ncbi:MAG: 5-nucleotidase / UDP-sugar diphosphatase [Hyphomicrobiales bacterium]|jgi:2',3'-cyclic-nucleotide 2'-phosphodiesterase (5'-nucleotidase family)|nr:5-nucleotidase / UDP-sugar diphosphatase [Hyphomicrobiales bacterium]